MQKEAKQLRAKQNIPIKSESQNWHRNANTIEMNADASIKGPVLLDAMFLSMPIDNHAGTSIIAPPIPSIPPVKPPAKPKIIHFFSDYCDILLDQCSKLYPKLTISSSKVICLLAIFLAKQTAIRKWMNTQTHDANPHFQRPIIDQNVLPPFIRNYLGVGLYLLSWKRHLSLLQDLLKTWIQLCLFSYLWKLYGLLQQRSQYRLFALQKFLI